MAVQHNYEGQPHFDPARKPVKRSGLLTAFAVSAGLGAGVVGAATYGSRFFENNEPVAQSTPNSEAFNPPEQMGVPPSVMEQAQQRVTSRDGSFNVHIPTTGTRERRPTELTYTPSAEVRGRIAAEGRHLVLEERGSIITPNGEIYVVREWVLPTPAENQPISSQENSQESGFTIPQALIQNGYGDQVRTFIQSQNIRPEQLRNYVWLDNGTRFTFRPRNFQGGTFHSVTLFLPNRNNWTMRVFVLTNGN